MVSYGICPNCITDENGRGGAVAWDWKLTEFKTPLVQFDPEYRGSYLDQLRDADKP